ncbi:U4/U6-U5 snRNP complex subunit [Martiniozyma asiatica (nom. inval.)]|nr:U4/U6-U5 snRNP complex subunit [Martiniozyma asiatica]
MSVSSSEPLDLIKLVLDESVYVKLKGSREIVGKLHAYDSHCNMVLGDAIETVYSVDADNNITTTTNESELLFIRGDLVILVSDAANV